MRKQTKHLLSVVLVLVIALSLTVHVAAVVTTDPSLPPAQVKNPFTEEVEGFPFPDFPLSFALQFTALEPTPEVAAKYEHWIADFVLEVSHDVKFFYNDPDSTEQFESDGYLAGEYGTYGWWPVPFNGFDLTPAVATPENPIAIMEYAANSLPMFNFGNITYEQVCEGVQVFNCGVYFEPEFLEAHPDFYVKLSLILTHPADCSEEGCTVTTAETLPIVTFDDFRAADLFVAEIGNKKFVTLDRAIAAAKDGDTVTLLKDVTVSEAITIEKDITLDLGAKKVTVQGEPDTTGFYIYSDVTVKNGSVETKGNCFVVGNSDPASAKTGKLTIESGSYKAGARTVASVASGSLTVNGGSFEAALYENAYEFLLDCVDIGYATGSASITVSGGSFKGFNPAANAAEGENTDFTTENTGVKEQDGIYTVHIHNSDTILPAKAQTCTGVGYTEGKACSVCDKVMVAREELPVLDHNWTRDFVAGSDTHWFACQNQGCDAKDAEAAHKYERLQNPDTLVTENDCAIQYNTICVSCRQENTADTYWVAKENPVHKYDAGKVTTQPTCTTAGVKTFTCQNAGCGHTKTEEIKALGHTTVDLPAKEATCTEPGITAGKMCSVCDAVIKAQETIAATGHTVVDLPAKEATCTEPGVTAGKKCSVCDAVIKAQETIAATGHTVVDLPAKEATCTEPGVTAGKKCSVCDAVIKAQETIAAKGHTEVDLPAKEATCTEPGITAGKKCSVCGAVTVAQVEVSATGHKLVKVDAVAATYFAAGNIDYYTCDNCDAFFADEKGEKALTAADITIPQLVKIEDTKAEISNEVVEDVVKEAVAAGNASVVITVTEDKLAVDKEEEDDTESDSPEAPAPAPVVTTTQLPVAAVEQVAELHEEATLTINMTNATVTMDKTTLDVVSEKAKTAQTDVVTLQVEHIETEELAPKQQAAVEDKKVAAVISASILVNDEEVHNFEGGKVTVAIPFQLEEGTKGSDYVVLYIADDGSVEDIPANYSDGTLVMTLSHFSEYVVVNRSVPKDPSNPGTGDSFQPAAMVMLMITATALVVLVEKKRYAK